MKLMALFFVVALLISGAVAHYVYHDWRCMVAQCRVVKH